LAWGTKFYVAETAENHEFSLAFFGDFPNFRLRRRSIRGRGCRPPHPATDYDLLARRRARTPPIWEGGSACDARGDFRVLCNPASLILLPCHPPPIPTPPPPVAGPTHSLPETGPQQRGGWWRSGAGAGRGASPMPPPVPGFHCPPPSLPAPCPLPLPLPLRLMALCCSQVMAVRGGRCAPAGEERRGAIGWTKRSVAPSVALGRSCPQASLFRVQKVRNMPKISQDQGLCPRTPGSTQCCYPCALRVARGGGEAWAWWSR